jgi:methylmalonyl-CoA/ethylmalonyl-CoA epimerase
MLSAEDRPLKARGIHISREYLVVASAALGGMRFMIKKFDHVGFVVKSTDEAVALFSNLFGFKIVEPGTLQEEEFKSTLISKEDVAIELIEPTGQKGIIQKFVEKHGGGLHHVSVQVDDLDGEIERLKAKGVQFVTEKPLQVDASRVTFVHPRSTGGLLIELVQRSLPR